MKRWIVCALVMGACSDDTGILVEVHGEQVQADIVRLETMVIVDDGSAAQPNGLAWGDAERIDAEVSIDLHLEPYTVMLRPEGGVGADSAVWVSALAYDANDALVGWGQIDTMVTFRQDIVKVVQLDLHGAAVVGEGCVVKDGVVVVRDTDDCDEDSFTFEVDCDDLDALVGGDVDGDPVVCDPDCDQENGEIYPGAVEECDGLDNDCDPFSRPPPQLCIEVAREGDQIIECSVGEQLCDDTNGGEPGLCVTAPIDVTANNELCHVWANCIDSGVELEECALDARMHCDVGFSDGGQPCLPGISTKLADLFGLADCSWRLVGNIQQGPWNIGLRQVGSTGPIAASYPGCDAELVVTGAGNLPHLVLLEADLTASVEVYSVVLDPTRTGCTPDQGSELECSVAP